MLRKVVLGSGLIALIPSVNAATPVPESTGPIKPPPMRPSELPIYESPHADYKEHVQANAAKTSSHLRAALHPPIQFVRERVQSVWAETESAKNTVKDNYNELRDRSEWIVQYLREEENSEIRYGAVAMGGLTGFIFGLRGGLIRRIFYATIGTTAMGYVCFPEKTKETIQDNSVQAKKYINIAYNFLYGVKPGDPQLEVKFPELSIPKDFSEFIDLTVSLASTVKQAIMPPPSKDAVESKSDHKE